jgi:exodeoxyribonuclease VII small subunit
MPEKPEDASYEDALQSLEELIEVMEAGEVPLAQLVEKYAEGDKLLKICEARLKEAELKIEKLKAGEGTTTFEPVDEPA